MPTGRVVIASGAITASANSAAFAVEKNGVDDNMANGKLCVGLDVTAVSGATPTLDVEVEWSLDGGTTFFKGEAVDTFTQITAAKKVVKTFDLKAPHYRLVQTVAGTTPSFTRSVHDWVN